MLQIALTILIYLILVIPAGVYVYHIAAGKHTFADPVFNRVDGAIYKVCGVNPKNGMNWKKYAVSLVITNGIMILLICRFSGDNQWDYDSAGIHNPEISEYWPVQSQWDRSDGGIPFL